jgi:hypothetical protein
VTDLIPKSIKTMVVTSGQREPLSFLPCPFEVKQVAKMGEKEGKIRKIGYLIEFKKSLELH